MKLLICSSLILSVFVYNVDSGKMKDLKTLLKGGAIIAGLMPQMIPIPIPIALHREHHHRHPVCMPKPVRIMKTEYVPISVETKTETASSPKDRGSDNSYSSEHIDEEMREERVNRY